MKPTLTSDHDAFLKLSQDMATMYMKRCENDWVKYEGNDFINTVGLAMHLRPDESELREGSSGDKVFFSAEIVKSIQSVLDAIRSYGGDAPEMIIYPVLLQIYGQKIIDNVCCLPVFQVRDQHNSSASKYIDTNGRMYSDAHDFQSNEKYPPGKISYPKNLHYTIGNDGNADIINKQTNAASSSATAWQVADSTATLLCLGAGVLAMFTGIGIPFAIASTIACAAYGITRSTQTLVDRATHAQTINPVGDWDAFNAWAGIGVTALGFGLAGNAIRLSGRISQLAAEGLRISQATRLGLRASIFVPFAVNGGVMIAQFYQLAAFWDRISIEQKIIVGLQFLFFAAASYKVPSLSAESLAEKANEVAFKELSEFAELEDEQSAGIITQSMETIASRFGGKNNRTLNFFKKLLRFKGGSLLPSVVDPGYSDIAAITEIGGEIGFNVRRNYFCSPEGLLQVINDMEVQRANGGRDILQNWRLSGPLLDNLRDNLVDAVIKTRRYTPAEIVEAGKNWLKSVLNVSALEDYRVNGVALFENMPYHDQVRLLIFENIARGFNEELVERCFQYAIERNPETIGQFASYYEICSMMIDKLANEMIKQFKGLSPAQVKDQFKVDLVQRNEKRLTYEQMTVSELFGNEPNKKQTEMRAINNVGENVVNMWKNSIAVPEGYKSISEPNASLESLANQIINLGELNFDNPEYLISNAAQFSKMYENGTSASFPQVFLNDANATIQSCRGNIAERVQVVDKPKYPNYRRVAFFNLDDPEYTKGTVVNVDKRDGSCKILNFTRKKSYTTSETSRNAKDALFDYWKFNMDYNHLKSTVNSLIEKISAECKDFVGPQVIRTGLNAEQTIKDIQSLPSVRFASAEHAICHVIKHAEDPMQITLSENNIIEAVRKYFNDAQEVIQSTIGHPENVSSAWTQTGSARDFMFLRKLPYKQGVDKVVVLVREGGEVIMKTYFCDKKLNAIPKTEQHFYTEPIDIKHADLRTFYFQLMIVTPRYGVLLPKNYELQNTGLSSEMTRTIIIMAAHYIQDDGFVNTKDLSKAITSAFPVPKTKWNVFAVGVDSGYSCDYFSKKFVEFRVNNQQFFIFVDENTKIRPIALKDNAKTKYGGLSRGGNVVIKENYGFDAATVDYICRICSNYSDGVEISKIMTESFGNSWNCFYMHTYDYNCTYHGYFIRIEWDNSTSTCVLFL